MSAAAVFRYRLEGYEGWMTLIGPGLDLAGAWKSLRWRWGPRVLEVIEAGREESHGART